ncbi:MULTISPECIES: flagellar FlbD family protein [Arthrobacter]|uniref:flagellar FlbD family protein n=1 Tax=unclassified Arthrobacter TaxID=235627 RepID=UPI0024B9EA98|nr:flagellar FlbD family protein [Arthrobacter sp. H35-MC1]MDJ0316653.1 flagellar FlbD family protein [Arthrobacter sp. H35-MC1]
MISVTRLDGREFALNPDLIERIFESPDTTVVMADGANYIVTESMAAIIEKIVRFRARIISMAHDYSEDEIELPAPPKLSIIHPSGNPTTSGS